MHDSKFQRWNEFNGSSSVHKMKWEVKTAIQKAAKNKRSSQNITRNTRRKDVTMTTKTHVWWHEFILHFAQNSQHVCLWTSKSVKASDVSDYQSENPSEMSLFVYPIVSHIFPKHKEMCLCSRIIEWFMMRSSKSFYTEIRFTARIMQFPWQVKSFSSKCRCSHRLVLFGIWLSVYIIMSHLDSRLTFYIYIYLMSFQ